MFYLFKRQGLCSRDLRLGFRAWGFGFAFSILGLRLVWDLGFRFGV